EATREAVARYARHGAWDLEKDTLDKSGWEGVFVAEGGEGPPLRFVARRRPGADHTAFALVIELEGADALRKDEVLELCLAHDLAAHERPPGTAGRSPAKTKGRIVEAAARIWDGGLNRE